ACRAAHAARPGRPRNAAQRGASQLDRAQHGVPGRSCARVRHAARAGAVARHLRQRADVSAHDHLAHAHPVHRPRAGRRHAAGAVLGGIVLESTRWLKPSVRAAMFSTIVWSACLLGFALSPYYPLSLLLLVGAGVANLTSQSTAQTLVQLLAPPEKRGRIVGV